MMVIGCTATRFGCTDHQLVTLRDLLDDVLCLNGFTAHHGMCIGGDAQFHAICREPRGGPVRIVGHPGLPADHRADVVCDEMRGPLPHMRRNATMVVDVAAASGVMISMPLEAEPQPHGGTWATTFMALRMLRGNRLRALHVIDPNGELLDHSGWRLR